MFYMREEIEGKLRVLQIEAKETRKRKGLFLLIAITIIALCILALFYYPQFGLLFIVAVVGGIFVLDGMNTLFHPLKEEFQAFQNFAHAIELLEKSKDEVVYEEVYRRIKTAYEILKQIDLSELGWYDWSNDVFEQFLDNLKLIILPAVAEGSIKTEHLEDIALALYETDPATLNAVNDKIESEFTYIKKLAGERKITTFGRKVKQSIIGKVLLSLAFGYFFILTASLIYVVLTQQDFMTFARERPDILLTGGLLASGITSVTIWKIR